MSSAADTLAVYARLLPEVGETIALKRGATSINVLAWVFPTSQTQMMLGGLAQGERRVLVQAGDVTFSPPLHKGDQAEFHGRVYSVTDIAERRVGGTLLAYDLTVKG